MKLKPILVMAIALAFVAPQLTAQSFLNKMKKKVETVTKTIDDAKSKVDKTTRSVGIDNRTANNGDNGYGLSGNENSQSKDRSEDKRHPTLTLGKFEEEFNLDPRKAEFKIARERGGHGDLELGDFHDGRAMVKDGKTSYFIDRKGNKYMVDQFYLESDRKMRPRFSNGRALVKTEVAYMIVDTLGNIIKKFDRTGIRDAFGFDAGVGAILYEDNAVRGINSRLQFIDTNGNNIFPLASHKGYIQSISLVFGSEREGMRAYKRFDPATKIARFGFINSKGQIAVKPQFAKVKDFHNGLAAVQESTVKSSTDILDIGGLWGFVDKKGNMVIPFTFSNEPSDFHNGIAIVKTRDGRQCLIDTLGNNVKIIDKDMKFLGFNDSGIGLILNYSAGTFGDSWNERVTYAVKDNLDNKIAYVEKTYDIVQDNDGEFYYKTGFAPMLYGKLNPEKMSVDHVGQTGFYSEGLAPTINGYVDEDGQYVILFTESIF